MGVTRFPYGVTNAGSNDPLRHFGDLDPTKYIVWFNDFVNGTVDYASTRFTITKDNSGTDTVNDGNGGTVTLTPGGTDDNTTFVQTTQEMFLLAAGKKAFFKAKFQVSDATQSDFVMGLQVKDTSPLDATDGIYFMKDDGDTNLDVYCRKDASTGSTSATAIHTMVNATDVVVAWYYDGVSSVEYWINGVKKGTLSGSSTYLPNTELAVSFGIQNGSTGAKTMTVDYIFAAMER